LREDGAGIVFIVREGKPCGRNCPAFYGAGNALPVLRHGSPVHSMPCPYLSPSLISFCSEINEQTTPRKSGRIFALPLVLLLSLVL